MSKRSKKAAEENFEESKNVIALKTREELERVTELSEEAKWTFNFSPNHIKAVLTHEYAHIAYLFIFIFSAVFLFYSFKTKAQMAIFYPSSCLGGWIGPDKAEGEASLPEKSDSLLFNSGNSAILKNTQGEVFCGNFVGEIPEDSIPKKFSLEFSWTIDEASVIHPEPEPFTPVNTDVIPEPAEALPEPAAAQSEVIFEPEEKSETKPEEKQSAPSSYFYKIAYAEEPEPATPQESPAPEITLPVSPETESSPVSEPTAVETPADPAEENPPSSETSAENLLDAAANAIEDAEIKIFPPASPESENFLEVSYTLDGITWNLLSKINRSNWQGKTFEIPLNSWGDVSKMQVSIKSIATIDAPPVVYLDAMRINVEYEGMLAALPAVASPYKISGVKSDTEGLSLSIAGRPEREYVLVKSASLLSGLAVYNSASGELMLNTGIHDSSYYLDAEYLKEGGFIAVNTADPDLCGNKTLSECMSDANFLGSGSFLISLKAEEPKDAKKSEESPPEESKKESEKEPEERPEPAPEEAEVLN